MIRREVQIGDCREAVIYALCEPGGVNPRYVGKTQRKTGKRHKEHLADALAKSPRLPVHRWLRSLYQRGLWSCFKYLEIVQPGHDWAERERFWIDKLRSDGADLLNLTDGGEGLIGHARPPEVRAAISAGLRKGSYFSCEVCTAPFWRKPRSIRSGDCRFCSRVCYQTWQRGRPKHMPKRSLA